jgi:hypothetical protein
MLLDMCEGAAMLRFLTLAGLVASVVLLPSGALVSRASSQQCGWRIVASPSPSGSQAAFQAVSELNADNVWAVARTKSGNLVEHWNGARWHIVPGPSTGGTLYAVNVVANRDVWFAGQVKTSPLIEHWNGARLSVVPNPARLGSLQSIYAVSPVDIWAAGYVDDNSPALIERWNGSAWRVASYPQEDIFQAISGTRSTDVWAAGNGLGGSDVPFSEIAHWNGSKWKGVDSSIFGEAGSSLNAVLALSHSNVWTVGDDADGSALIARYNGASWRAVASPAPTASLVSLAAWNPHALLAAGGTLAQHAFIERWNGLRWRKVILPAPPRSPSFFEGITVGPRGTGWAVGFDGAGANTHTLTEHYRTCT